MENKQKALEMAAAMQQKEKSGSLLWCVAEDLKATIQSMNEEEAKVIVADLEAGTHDLKTCEKAIHDYANKHKSGGSACCPDRKSTRLNSSHNNQSRMPSSA